MTSDSRIDDVKATLDAISTADVAEDSAYEIRIAELIQENAVLTARIAELEFIPPDPPLPPPVVDRWKDLTTSPHCLFASTYNDPAEYPKLLHGGSGYIGVNVFHDPVEKAARFFIPKGELSLPLGANFRPKFPAITNDIVSVQWEVKYDPLSTPHGGKAFQLGYSVGGDKRLIEIQQFRIGDVGNYRGVLYSIRTYTLTGAYCGGNGNLEQLSTGPLTSRDVHTSPLSTAPVRLLTEIKDLSEGGQTKLVKPGVWTRVTVSWDLSETPARLKMWVDDTLIMADPEDETLGFIFEPDPLNHAIDHVWIPEFNNSTTVATVDVSQWVRNVVVWKGADIPR